MQYGENIAWERSGGLGTRYGFGEERHQRSRTEGAAIINTSAALFVCR